MEENNTYIEFEHKNMLEISLFEPEDFLKVKETLTRIGIASIKSGDQKLFQSCHILHKRGKYYLVHFKELFCLDGRDSKITEIDIRRRNTIATLLENWGMIEVKSSYSGTVPLSHIKVISHNEKKNWQLIPKYTLGK